MLNLNRVVTDTNTMLRRLIGEDIVLTTVLDPALKPVKVDPGQIQQVLMNLAVNARDAMPQGGQLTVETQHVILDESYRRDASRNSSPAQYSMLAVTDTGTGMDEATKARIFEPFFTRRGGEGHRAWVWPSSTASSSRAAVRSRFTASWARDRLQGVFSAIAKMPFRRASLSSGSA